MKNIMLYNDCLNQYKKSMQNYIDEVENFYGPLKAAEIHDDTKRNSLSQVWIKS